jgi:hypothetical protein
LKSFTSVITVMNYPEGHWVALQFHPKKEILEVFDSMAPNPFKHRMEEIHKVRDDIPTMSPNVF